MKNIFELEANLFTTLANPKRLEILHLLSHEDLCVSQIVEMTGIPQATVSQHLSVLRRVGVVTSSKQAQNRLYRLHSNHIRQATDAMRKVLLERYDVGTVDAIEALTFHTDPICGMKLTTEQAAASLVVNHKRYYFCGLGCAEKFKNQEGAL